MKINISRQIIYLLVISLIFLLFVMLFSFLVLIPQGKDYRVKRLQVKKQNMELIQLQNYAEEVSQQLHKLSTDNRHIITAFDTKFDEERFVKLYKGYFSSLRLSEKKELDEEDGFSVYEVNTTSQINSPKTFYNFLEAINKSDWIIKVNFPINFERDGELIKSSFNMKVYSNSKKKKDTNRSISKESLQD